MVFFCFVLFFVLFSFVFVFLFFVFVLFCFLGYQSEDQSDLYLS